MADDLADRDVSPAAVSEASLDDCEATPDTDLDHPSSALRIRKTVSRNRN
jgi:hypothetical protein